MDWNFIGTYLIVSLWTAVLVITVVNGIREKKK